MAIGERIHLFRTRKGLLQKQLGKLLGFSEKTAEVRIAQYENDARAPKEDLVKQMAQVLDVRPEAIRVPDIDTYVGLAHTLFTLEDRYGFKPGEIDGELCIRLNKYHREFHEMWNMLQIWSEKAKQVKDETITKEEYDDWRYHYPDNTPSWSKVNPEIFTQDEIKKITEPTEKED